MLPPAKSIIAYMGTVRSEERTEFERICRIVQEMVPEGGEGISYAMNCFMYHGKPLLSFISAKKHLSLFPFSGRVVDFVKDRLEGFSLSSGTIRFSVAQPIPEDVLRDVIRARMEEIDTAK